MDGTATAPSSTVLITTLHSRLYALGRIVLKPSPKNTSHLEERPPKTANLDL